MIIHEWLESNLSSDCTILEAGVYDGSDTLRFARNFPDCKVYGFEPVESLFNRAIHKVKGYDRVVIEKKALDHESGHKEMHISYKKGKVYGSSSLLEPKDHLRDHPKITFNNTETVETVSLDDWIRENGIDCIDLAWLDMQGYEPVLLQNSPLAVSKINFLYTEVSTVETYKSVMQYGDYKDFLLGNGFEVVHEGVYWKDGGNVLFRKMFDI